MNHKITAIVIAKNEESMISSCLKTLSWCDEILVIDNDSTDQTIQKAKELGAKIIGFKSKSFSEIRNEALNKVTTDWLFYVDADERVSQDLAKEIKNKIQQFPNNYFKINRTNYCYGKILKHGGFGNDFVTRIFNKNNLVKWEGVVHESPVTTGELTTLSNPLIHLAHRSIKSGLIKSTDWTEREAKEIFNLNKSKVSIFKIIKKSHMEFIRRYFFKLGFLDGKIGFIESLVQGLNKCMVYLQVWNMQHQKEINNNISHIEKELSDEITLSNRKNH